MAERDRQQFTRLPEIGFIPQRLLLPEAPQLYYFPDRITITQFARIPTGPVFVAAIYEPDFDTYEEEERKLRLDYENTVHPRYSIKMEYNTEEHRIAARKFDKDNLIGFVENNDWIALFQSVNQFGIGQFEGYRIIKGSNMPTEIRQ